MNQQPQFIKKRLSQIVAATVLASVGMTAQAGDFSLSNNEISFGVDTITVDASGVASHQALISAPASFLPNITFSLINHSDSDGEYFVRLRMQIDSQTDNDRVTMVMGVVRVTVAAGVVTGAAVVLPNEANYQQINVNATKQTSSSTTSLSSNIPANAAMISSSGNQITVQVDEVYNRLVGDNALFDDIIGGFLLNDHYDYKIGVESVSAPTTLSVGHFNSVDDEFTAFPRLLNACSGFTVLGTLTIGNPSAALINAVAQEESGCEPDVEEPDEEDVIDQGTIDDLTGDTEQLQQQLDNELQSGTVSDTTVTQTTTLTTDAANLTQTLNDAANSGDPINVGNTLNALTAISGTASLGGQVAAAATGTEQQQTLIDQNVQILTGTANVLNAMAQQSSTELTPAQATQVNTIVSNAMNTLSSLAETTASSPTDLADLARQANALTQAKANLGIAATADESAQVQAVSQKLALSVITKVLTENGGTAPTDAEIEAALEADPDLLAAVVDASLDLPPTSTEVPAVTRQRILDAFETLTGGVFPIPSSVIVMFRWPSTFQLSFGDGLFNPSEIVSLALSGESNGATLALNGRQVLALEAGDVTVESDPVTGALKISLPGESYTGTVLAIKSVPTSVPTGISFLNDGRAVIIRSGLAIELAPVSVDQLGFMAATLTAGYTPSFRPANGSFSLDLGSTQRFSGAFAYDNLTGKDLDSCGTITFAAPTGAVNSAAYAFVANCSTGGISQRITPFIDNADFFRSIGGFGYSANVDRTSGIITVTGVGKFKPSFFVDALTTADTTYYNANKDSFSMAYQGGDFNGDGKLDFKVISTSGVQLLYGTN